MNKRALKFAIENIKNDIDDRQRKGEMVNFSEIHILVALQAILEE
ncbi:MAG: hypothetical protein AABY22_36220 [Nanoarchaeota archaeon]